jgi:4-hydroxy-3-methylbut-2-enyl diphosphate reductase
MTSRRKASEKHQASNRRPTDTGWGNRVCAREKRRPRPAAPARRGGRVVLAEPRSLCAGVRRAIEIVDEALRQYAPPIYVRKEIVHNHYVVRDLERRGVAFVHSEAEVPEGAVCVFSAHRVSPAVREHAADRQLRAIDATCPLVAKVHRQTRRYARDGRTILLIGHANHEDVESTYGEAPDRTIVVADVADVARLDLPRHEPVAALTQTTLSLDEIGDVIAALASTTCAGRAATTSAPPARNRQNAVKEIAAVTDVVLVVGANSGNSVRIVEVAASLGLVWLGNVSRSTAVACHMGDASGSSM